MKFDVLTIFPSMFEGYFSESILKRARERGLLDVRVHDLRDWTTDKHHKVDDKPYGGGPGMVMKVEPFDLALKALKVKKGDRVVLMSAKGKKLTDFLRWALADGQALAPPLDYSPLPEAMRTALIARLDTVQ